MRGLWIWLLLLSVLLACTDQASWSGERRAQAWIVTDVRPLLADMRFARLAEGVPETASEPAPAAAEHAALPAPAIIVDAPNAGRPVIDWRNPLEGWLSVDAYLAASQQAPDVETARGLLILSLALNDTLHAARTARAAGMTISDEVALAAAATRVLPVSRGLAGRGARGFAVDALAELSVDAETRLASRQLGVSVAGVGLERLLQPAPLIGVADEIELTSGTRVSDAVSTSEQQGLLAALPASEAARSEVLAWYGPQAPAPPLRWLVLAGEQAAMAELDVVERAGLYAQLAVAMADSGLICLAQTDRIAGERPVDWLAETQPAWEAVVPVHSSVRSQSSCISAAAAEILAAHFPAARDVFVATAAEAGAAAVAAGWLWPAEDRAAQEIGKAVAQQVLAAPAANSK